METKYIIILSVIAVVVLLGILIATLGYVKATPDTAKVISGITKKPRTIIGRAGFRIPFFEKVDELLLKLISVNVETSSTVPTKDYINIRVDSVVNVQVSKDPNLILLAERNFLNQKESDIASVAREVLEGNVREIVGQMKLEEMVGDRAKFADLVKANSAPDLANMGLDIISFNVQNFIDDEHVIENLGVDNIVRIQKNAAISRAESERDIAQAQALSRTEIAKAEAAKNLEIAKVNAETEMTAKQKEAEADLAIQKAEIERDRAANQARVEAEQNIIEKEQAKEQKRAELEAVTNTEKAKADSAYKIQEQEQRKTIEAKTAEANLIKQSKEVEIRKKQAEIQQAELDAQIKKQADAKRYAAEQTAEANAFQQKKNAEAEAFQKMKDAEASKYEAEQNAAAELAKEKKDADAALYQQQKAAEAKITMANAEKATVEAKSEATLYQQQKDAEAIIAKAEAEKSAIEAKATAEKTAAEAKAQGELALAKAIAAKGEAEADAIKAKAVAEAEGTKQKLLAEAEGIDKKAEAQNKMGQASILEMQLEAVKVYFHQLPEIAGNMAKPLAAIDKVTMYGEGDVSKFMSGLTSTFKQITDSMDASGGMNIGTLISSFLGNKMANGIGDKAVDATALTELAKTALGKATAPNK
jgi:flotillin